MEIEKYNDYLRSRDLDDKRREQQLVAAKDFIDYLASLEEKRKPEYAGQADIESYVRILIDENRNTSATFAALRDLGDWLSNREMYVAFTRWLDGANVMELFSREIRTACGDEIHDQIFSEPMPPLGVSAVERSRYTATLMERVTDTLTPDIYQKSLDTVRHGVGKGDFSEERRTYLELQNIDAYLDWKREQRDKMLAKLNRTGRPFYIQLIENEVLEFIKRDPEMMVGRRQGRNVYFTKIPHETIKYLNEKDEIRKRYYVCHCYWARESILSEKPVSSEFCHCSLGHAKRSLEGALGCEVEGEIVESALKGDLRCRFAFHLPQGIE